MTNRTYKHDPIRNVLKEEARIPSLSGNKNINWGMTDGAYKQHIASLTEIVCAPSTSWPSHGGLVEGKDFEMVTLTDEDGDWNEVVAQPLEAKKGVPPIIGLANEIFKVSKPLDGEFAKVLNETHSRLFSKTPTNLNEQKEVPEVNVKYGGQAAGKTAEMLSKISLASFLQSNPEAVREVVEVWEDGYKSFGNDDKRRYFSKHFSIDIPKI
jgi:hypothetical protein